MNGLDEAEEVPAAPQTFLYGENISHFLYTVYHKVFDLVTVTSGNRAGGSAMGALI